jgi:hypothetical protein
MGVSVASLIAATRIDSGLRNNRFFSNDQIAEKLTDAYADLRDKMIIRFAFWFKKTFNFSLAGGVGGNILTLSSNVPDLEMIQYLNLLDSSGSPSPVTMLSSVAERNQYAANFPFAVGNGFNGYVGRKYFPDGDDLEILPAQNSLGNYELVYTPQPQRLALPITKTFTIASSDVPLVPPPGLLAGTGAWLLANAGADDTVPSDGGFNLTLTLAAPNASFSGTYNVVGVGIPPNYGVPTFGVSNLASTAGFMGPPAGSGTYTYQPVGTIGELPEALTPWAKYLQIQASIAIRTAQRKSIAALDLQRQVFEKRIVALTKQRSQGVTQAPITQTNYGSNFGGTFGNG